MTSPMNYYNCPILPSVQRTRIFLSPITKTSQFLKKKSRSLSLKMAAPPSTPPQSDPPTPNANDSPNSLSSAGSGSIDPTLLDEEENPLEEGIVDNIVAPSSQQHAISGPGPGYNALKTHQGQLCSGMAVGSSHTWKYEPGTWKETKEEPDRWRIDYQTKKLRARNAPKGSGAPVGTEYHWLIVGHQVRFP